MKFDDFVAFLKNGEWGFLAALLIVLQIIVSYVQSIRRRKLLFDLTYQTLAKNTAMEEESNKNQLVLENLSHNDILESEFSKPISITFKGEGQIKIVDYAPKDHFNNIQVKGNAIVVAPFLIKGKQRYTIDFLGKVDVYHITILAENVVVTKKSFLKKFLNSGNIFEVFGIIGFIWIAIAGGWEKTFFETPQGKLFFVFVTIGAFLSIRNAFNDLSDKPKQFYKNRKINEFIDE
jgi:heme exporter protein D